VKTNSTRATAGPSSTRVARPEVRFEGGVMTAYGGAGLLRTWLEKLGLREQLAPIAGPGEGRKYRTADYLMGLVSGALLGCGRQSEIAALGQDPGALMALGLPGMFSQPSLSRFLKGCRKSTAEHVLGINRRLLQWLRGNYVTATIDLDGEVISTRGHPCRATRGYNPKRRGAKSYFGMFGFLAEGRDILTADLRPGKEASVSARGAIALYEQSRRSLPPGLRQVRLRADAAFASEAFFARLEADQVTYCVAAPTPGPVKRAVAALEYRPLDRKWAIAEFAYQGGPWTRARRLVVIRERLDPIDPPSKQLKLLDCPGYGYQVIVTNSDWRAEKVWRFYNGRCRLENILKETQTDFGGDHVLAHGYGGNALWLAVTVLAYNLMNWFREKVLDQRGHRHTAGWLRRVLIAIPARLVHTARRWVLKVWQAHPSRALFERASQRLAVLRL